MSGYFPKADFSPDERKQMARISDPFASKAAKIRALGTAGYKKQTIAAFLGIRYQHVRNVLVNRPDGEGAAAKDAPAQSELLTDATGEVPTFGRSIVDEQGRIALPAALLAALEAKAGDPIPWRFEDGELKLMTRSAGIRFAQSLVADLAKRHRGNWSDELIAQRRAEARREDARQGHE